MSLTHDIQPNPTIFGLFRLPCRFSGQFGPEKGAPGPKNGNFQKIKISTSRYSPKEK